MSILQTVLDSIVTDNGLPETPTIVMMGDKIVSRNALTNSSASRGGLFDVQFTNILDTRARVLSFQNPLHLEALSSVCRLDINENAYVLFLDLSAIDTVVQRLHVWLCYLYRQLVPSSTEKSELDLTPRKLPRKVLVLGSCSSSLLNSLQNSPNGGRLEFSYLQCLQRKICYSWGCDFMLFHSGFLSSPIIVDEVKQTALLQQCIHAAMLSLVDITSMNTVAPPIVLLSSLSSCFTYVPHHEEDLVLLTPTLENQTVPETNTIDLPNLKTVLEYVFGPHIDCGHPNLQHDIICNTYNLPRTQLAHAFSISLATRVASQQELVESRLSIAATNQQWKSTMIGLMQRGNSMGDGMMTPPRVPTSSQTTTTQQQQQTQQKSTTAKSFFLNLLAKPNASSTPNTPTPK